MAQEVRMISTMYQNGQCVASYPDNRFRGIVARILRSYRREKYGNDPRPKRHKPFNTHVHCWQIREKLSGLWIEFPTMRGLTAPVKQEESYDEIPF